MTQASIASYMGAILICAGIAQIFAQMFIVYRLERDNKIKHLSFAPPNHLAELGKTWSFRTSYPGILMILLGALLLGLAGWV